MKCFKGILGLLCAALFLIPCTAFGTGEVKITDATGKTIYAVYLNPSGQVWNGTTFAAITNANWATYGILLTEQGTTGIYLGNFPTVITTAGRYSTLIYEEATTGTEAVGDKLIGSGSLDWNGTVVITLTSLNTTTSSILTSSNNNGTAIAAVQTSTNNNGTAIATGNAQTTATAIGTAVWTTPTTRTVTGGTTTTSNLPTDYLTSAEQTSLSTAQTQATNAATQTVAATIGTDVWLTPTTRTVTGGNIATIASLAPPINWNLTNIDTSGRVLLQPTQTGVTIPTVTTVTNGVIASNFTSAPTVAQIAAAILVTPANLLSTNATGQVSASNLPTDYLSAAEQTSLTAAQNQTTVTTIGTDVWTTPTIKTITGGNVGTINSLAPPINWNLTSIDALGRVLLQPTETGVTIPVVTSVTNSVIASNFVAAPTVTQIAASILASPTNLLATNGTGQVSTFNLPSDYLSAVEQTTLTSTQTQATNAATQTTASTIGTDVWTTPSARTITGGTITASNLPSDYLTAGEIAALNSVQTQTALAAIQNDVWSTTGLSFTGAGTTGLELKNAGVTGSDPWLTTLPGTYASGTAGYLLGHPTSGTTGPVNNIVLPPYNLGATPTTRINATALINQYGFIIYNKQFYYSAASLPAEFN